MLISAIQQSESAICIHTSPLPWFSFPFSSPQNIEQRSSCCTIRPQLSILYIVCIYASLSLPIHPNPSSILLFSMSYTRISKRFCSFFLKYREEKLSLLFPHLTLLHAMICLLHSPQTFQLFGLIEGIRSVENLKQKLWPKFFMFILSSRKRNTVKNPPASKWLEGCAQLLGALVLLDSPPFTEGLLLPMDRFLASCQALFKLPKCL